MASVLFDPFSQPYLQRALIEAVLLGVLAGVVGVHVVLRKLAFLADTFTHTVFPGLAVAFALEASLFVGALIAGVLSAVAFTVLDRNRRITSDAALAVVLTCFFAVGVVVISRTERYTADLTGLLFGRILFVDRSQITETAVVLVVVALVLLAIHKELVLRAFDPDGAAALGYRVGAIDLGTLLTVALIIVPAATAQLVGRSVGAMYVIAAAVGALGGWLGLVASYEASIHHDLRLASGATIVLALTGLFAVVLGGRAVARTVAASSTRRAAAAGA